MKTLVAAALGECVHVAGVMSFLRLAERAGWRTVFLGPAVPPETVIAAAQREQADMVAVSYRLTPDNGERLLAEFAEEADALREAGVQFAFGGTPPVAERARSLGFFHGVFDGTEPVETVMAYLRGEAPSGRGEADYPQTLVERIRWKAPYPILRHHYGQATVEETAEGIARIAEAGVLDCVSLGTDQDAQASFFHPERQDPRTRGAGGVPVRSAEDFRALFAATRRGNYPLMRTYTGTDDFLRLAELYVREIHQAWAAVPVFWFNRMDGRGPWALAESIRAHLDLMRWYAERDIPVEVNEPHHWGLRDAPDVIFVVAGYLSAYLARACGVREHVAQFMMNTPPGLGDAMDLAKMLAIVDLVEPLTNDGMRIWRQTRTGLLSYPVDEDEARGHLGASVYLQMALRPHIVHVVAQSEAHHAATADDVIEACRMARRAIANAVAGQPDMTLDPDIAARRAELVAEARVTIDAIRRLGREVEDPLADPQVLTRAVTEGILDAPHLQNNPYARGEIATRIDARGACVAVDPSTGEPLGEEERIASLQTAH